MTQLGSVLRKYRIMQEIPVRELATEMGIGFATLSRIEQGRAIDAATLLKVLNWLLSEKEKQG